MNLSLSKISSEGGGISGSNIHSGIGRYSFRCAGLAKYFSTKSQMRSLDRSMILSSGKSGNKIRAHENQPTFKSVWEACPRFTTFRNTVKTHTKCEGNERTNLRYHPNCKRSSVYARFCFVTTLHVLQTPQLQNQRLRYDMQ